MPTIAPPPPTAGVKNRCGQGSSSPTRRRMVTARVMRVGIRVSRRRGGRPPGEFAAIQTSTFLWGRGLPCPHVHCIQRSEEHTSELQSPLNIVCRLLLEKKKKKPETQPPPTKTTRQRPPTRSPTTK